jgi:hypothetical protein
MASFTDNPQALGTFNPYVQQLPVEAMVKVGMQKQEQYNQGIQKIQTAIDNIAGLDIAKDADKAYLQSKVNELGNNLKFVAAGDFSDFQLVNSVNGMTNQLVKDPNVVNAVSSTAKLRKEQAFMEEQRKAGKSSPANEWDFNSKANAWLNSSEIGESFSAKYNPYTDYKKNAIDIVKALAKNETTKDVSLEYDSKGNIIGVLDATTRTKISGITPERIQQALMVGLSTADFSQMQIDGRYNYSNTSIEKFDADITTAHEKNILKYNEQKQKLLNSLTTTNSVLEKTKIQEQIKEVDKVIQSVDEEYNSIHNAIISGNSEAAKAQLFTTKWINNFSQTFASQDISQTDEVNPYQQPKQFRETKALEWKKFTMDYEQKERFHKDDNYYKEQTLKAAKAKNAADSGYGGIPMAVDQSTVPDVSISKLILDVKKDIDDLEKSDEAIMKQFNKSGNKGWLDQQLLAYQASPSSVDPILAAYFYSTESKKRDIVAIQSTIADINKKAEDAYGNIYKNIPKDSKQVRVNLTTGTYVYSPKDFIDFNTKFKNYYKVSSSGGTGGGYSSVKYNDEKAKEELSDKEYFLYQAMKNPSTDTQKLLTKNAQFYNKNVNIPYNKVLKEKEEFVSKEIKSRVIAMQGMNYAIPLDNDAQKTSFGSVLTGFAKLADDQGGKLPYSPTLDTNELRKIASNVETATIDIVEGTKYAPGMYQITVVGKDGNTQTFRVPPEAYKSVFQGRFDASMASQAARPYLEQMERTQANTTAFDGKPTTIANAFLGKIDFPNTNYFGVSGNIVRMNGAYSIRLNLIDPKTKKLIVSDQPYPSSGLIDENKIGPALQGLTDSVIFEIIYGRNPTAKEISQLKNNAQKPN